jgi:cytochrome P450 family 4 subfamily B polypeptide 1
LIDNYLKLYLEGNYDLKEMSHDLLGVFFGGNETTARSVVSFTYRMCHHPEYLKKLRDELRHELLHDGKIKINELNTVVTLENIHNLPYLSYCYKECLRIDSISTNSGLYTAINDANLGPYHFKKGTIVMNGIECLHNDPIAWKNPREFIPHRFDPESEYFLTPTGEKRDPLNFEPFSVGARNCPGQNLGLTEGKVLCALVALNFDFEVAEEIAKLKDISWSFGSVTELKVKVKKIYSS